MAITKIHGIKATVNKAIKYICNPDKTDEKIFISSFACAPETAALDFKYTLDHTRELTGTNASFSENKAFHLIQAFAPGEVSFEEAHAIGKELAERLLEGKFSYVLTTHIDKGHVHNHLIFCSVDNIEHNHYHDEKKSYYRIRNLSDTLCKEHGLSIVEPSGRKGKQYKEWQSEQNGTCYKNTLRKDINQSIKATSSYDDFLSLMRAKGYEMKGTLLSSDGGKYISFRPLGKERFIRGSVKSLGANYTKERIKERIENKKERTASFLKSNNRLGKLIDTDNDPKFTQNIGLMKWATKENLKIAAKTYSLMNEKGITTFQELDERIASLKQQAKTANETIVSIEHKLRDLAEIIKYAEQFAQYKSCNAKYENSADKDRFFRNHESELILFEGAKRMLERSGIDPEHIKLKQIKNQYNGLFSKKEELDTSRKSALAELKELELIKQNMEQYLHTSSDMQPSKAERETEHKEI